MKATDANTKLLNSYVGLLQNLSTDNKLELISKLSQSIKSTSKKKKSSFYQAYGAWDQDETADELVQKIRGSRNFNRNIEKF
jgi:hypothetical protein